MDCNGKGGFCVVVATLGIGLMVVTGTLSGSLQAQAEDGVSEKWRTMGDALQRHAVAPPLSPSVSEPSVGDEGYVWNMGSKEQDAALHLTANPTDGAEVYRMCVSCHGAEGWGEADGTYPQIAGQHASVTIKQLADIRALNRDNPTMYIFALPSQIGGAQAIADVAAYLESLPMTENVGMGDGKDLAHGKALYEKLCAECHGINGEGDASRFYPRLQAQHYRYTMRQYEWIKEGRRRNANPDMMKQIQNMSMQDQQAVLDYVSRLKPDSKSPVARNP